MKTSRHISNITFDSSFGCALKERGFSSSKYRYGMNGQEHEDEITNSHGAIYSAEYWMYDARLGRRWNTDQINYPWQSPYACFNNNPIYFSDPLGLEGTPPGGSEVINFPSNPSENQYFDPSYTGDDGVQYMSHYQYRGGTWERSGMTHATLPEATVEGEMDPEIKAELATEAVQEVLVDMQIARMKSRRIETSVDLNVSIGVQAKAKVRAAGVLDIKAEVNLVNYELADVHADYANSDYSTYDVIGGDGGVKVKQSFGLSAKAGGAEIGAEFEHSFTETGSGVKDQKVQLKMSVGVPVANYLTVKYQTINRMRLVHNAKLQKKIEDAQTQFYGIDIGAGAALILGIDFNLKIGIYD